MLARKIDRFLVDYYQHTNKALLITGARQTGKTFSIRQFGQQFQSFIEINFIENPEAVQLFKNAKNSQDILFRLSMLTTRPLNKGNTLIFFDEVQQCPEIVTAIKFLVDEGSYRYILSGSLLGVALKDLRSEPVGYMGVKEMYPLDFEEFITSLGVHQETLQKIHQNWETNTPVDDFVHKKMLELFRLYLIVGGMPAAVNTYIEHNNFQLVLQAQQDILHLYKRDIAQYDHQNKLSIEHIFDLIPPELNAKNKRFFIKRLSEKARFDVYQNSFLWLVKAGVALPVYNITEPKAPLLFSRSRNLFKLFQSDVGLLSAQYADGIQQRIIDGYPNINFGAVYENVIAQELIAHGLTPYYYNNKKRGEVDFIIELDGDIIPIEVKSGKDYTSHRALTNLMSDKNSLLNKAIVFSNANIKVENKTIYAPIYMSMFLQKNNNSPTHYKVDLTGL